MTYKKELSGDVVLRMTQLDYDRLLVTLGYAIGVFLQQGGKAQLNMACDLVNRMNEGNPNYKPYQV